jgi:hypothetical protein
MRRLGVGKYVLIIFAVLVLLAVIAETCINSYRTHVIHTLRKRVMVVGDMEGLVFQAGDAHRPIPRQMEETIVEALAVVEKVRYPISPKWIVFKNMDVSGQAFSSLSRLTALKDLRFDECTVDNESLSRLCELPGLEKIGFISCNVSNDGLSRLRCVRGLKTLALREAHLTTEGIDDFRAKRPDVDVKVYRVATTNDL